MDWLNNERLLEAYAYPYAGVDIDFVIGGRSGRGTRLFHEFGQLLFLFGRNCHSTFAKYRSGLAQKSLAVFGVGI